MEMVNVEYNPKLVFFWIAEYNNGFCLCQFDPITGVENKFSDIDQSRLKAFGWYPFPPDFADKLRKIGYNVESRPLNYYKIVLAPGWRLIAFRRNTIKIGMNAKGELIPETQKRRVMFYALGCQKTVCLKGKKRNVKAIMFIDEWGNVTMSEDYDLVGEKRETTNKSNPTG